MHEKIIKRAGEIVAQCVRETGYCALALIDTDGSPAVSTISPSKTEGIECLYLCTGLHSPRTVRIKNSNRAGVCFNSLEYNISLVGTIEIITDPQIKKEMWYDGLKNHFSGPEDPNYCVLRFKTERYSLLVDWEEARGKL